MRSADLRRRRAVGEIVECQGLARHAFGALQRIRMPVIRKIRRAEKHHPIEHREYLGFAAAHITVPQFEMTAVLFTPILVQVKQKIQATVESKGLMLVKICVYRQLAATHDLVKTSTIETRIRNQIIDSRDAAQKLQKGNGIQMI